MAADLPGGQDLARVVELEPGRWDFQQRLGPRLGDQVVKMAVLLARPLDWMPRPEGQREDGEP